MQAARRNARSFNLEDRQTMAWDAYARGRFLSFALTGAIAAGVSVFPADAACFRGINLSGAEFGEAQGAPDKDYTHPSDRTIGYFAKKGFNTVRLPFLWERLQPRLMQDLDRDETRRLADAVSRLKQAGLKVILDPHNYGRYAGNRIGSDQVPDEAFADFWRRLAAGYANDPAVQFGLMNEPHDIAASRWLASANAAIAAIRSQQAGNLILVPGTNWTGAHSWGTGDPAEANGTVMLGVQDPAQNYAYEVHQYLDGDFSGTHATCERAQDAVTALQGFTEWLRANGKRGFLGEFGGSAKADCLDGIARMVEVIDSNPDIWTGWSYWVAGDWWPASEPLNIQPVEHRDRPQLKALEAGLSKTAGACPALENGR